MEVLPETIAVIDAMKAKKTLEEVKRTIEKLNKYFRDTNLPVGVEKTTGMELVAEVLQKDFEEIIKEIVQC